MIFRGEIMKLNVQRSVFVGLLVACFGLVSLASGEALARGPSEKECLAKRDWDRCDSCCATAKTNEFRTECKASCRAKFSETEVSERACLAKDSGPACESCCKKAKTNEFRTECMASCRSEFPEGQENPGDGESDE